MPTRRASIAVPGAPSAVAFARDRVLTQVRGWGVPLTMEKREALKLVASELITNAVVHSEGMAMVGLYYDQGEGRLLLVVHDSNPEPPQSVDATAEDEGGRGLTLVEALAAEHDWEATTRGKKVWAAFEVSAPSPPARAALLRRRLRALTPRSYAPGIRPLPAVAGL